MPTSAMYAWGFVRLEIVVGLGKFATMCKFDNCVALSRRKGSIFNSHDIIATRCLQPVHEKNYFIIICCLFMNFIFYLIK